jgi:hypothetical protein
MTFEEFLNNIYVSGRWNMRDEEEEEEPDDSARMYPRPTARPRRRQNPITTQPLRPIDATFQTMLDALVAEATTHKCGKCDKIFSRDELHSINAILYCTECAITVYSEQIAEGHKALKKLIEKREKEIATTLEKVMKVELDETDKQRRIKVKKATEE